MKIDKDAVKAEFIEMLRSTKREGVEYVIEEIERLGFFEAPASANHHLNVEGGLTLHSLNVAKASLAVWEAYPGEGGYARQHHYRLTAPRCLQGRHLPPRGQEAQKRPGAVGGFGGL